MAQPPDRPALSPALVPLYRFLLEMQAKYRPGTKAS